MAKEWRNMAMARPWLIHLLLLAALLPLATRPAGASGEAQLEIRVVDDDSGQPVPARMHLRDARGKAVKPPGLIWWHDHFVIPGTAVLELRPGTYTFELERGPEYRVRSGHFTVKRADADHTEVRMQRFADMKAEGWWSGDLHIHRPHGERAAADGCRGSARGAGHHLVERHGSVEVPAAAGKPLGPRWMATASTI
jgi:hypothetical protein